MESAPEEHSSDANTRLTHSVSNPQFSSGHSLSDPKAESAPEQEVGATDEDIQGESDFDVKDTTLDLYNEIGKFGPG